MSHDEKTEDRPAEVPRGGLLRAPGFWIAAFFVVLVTMNIIFFWIAGSNPPDFIGK
jgi:hypothetical protein